MITVEMDYGRSVASTHPEQHAAAMEQVLAATDAYADQIAMRLRSEPRRASLFRSCFRNTVATTMQPLADGTVFVVTGDIPAMWLRDSAAQIRPYLALARESSAVADLLVSVVRRQLRYVAIDPYANAFNPAPNGACHRRDFPDQSPWVWERKYEIDSLCYPIRSATEIWRATGRTDHLDDTFVAAVRVILQLWRLEQDHPRSKYRFHRRGAEQHDTLSHAGRGAPVAPTGMTWSGFRPSDDACTYGYLIPANAFAAVVLGDLAGLARDVLADDALAAEALSLRGQIVDGIAGHGLVELPGHGTGYAYEVDGMGNALLMDDANIPSLLSLPYLGFCTTDDPHYQANRAWILSRANPWYFSGTAAAGVGSPHTPTGYVWHLALAMQGLTTDDPRERDDILRVMEATDAGTGLMHEGFDVDDPARFTRPWFSWANALYCELVLASLGIDPVP